MNASLFRNNSSGKFFDNLKDKLIDDDVKIALDIKAVQEE